MFTLFSVISASALFIISNFITGANINSPDLRAGAAFVIAGLIAQGETIVNNAEIIDRGYENFELKLKKLGAEIKRVNL